MFDVGLPCVLRESILTFMIQTDGSLWVCALVRGEPTPLKLKSMHDDGVGLAFPDTDLLSKYPELSRLRQRRIECAEVAYLAVDEPTGSNAATRVCHCTGRVGEACRARMISSIISL